MIVQEMDKEVEEASTAKEVSEQEKKIEQELEEGVCLIAHVLVKSGNGVDKP